MTAPKIDTQAPERVWLKPCDPCNAPDDYYVCDPDCLDGRETEYILASFSAAREAAAAQAMREAAAQIPDNMLVCYMDGSTGAGEDIAQEIRALPLPDTAALDRLIAERVREAVEAEREACAKVAESQDDGWGPFHTDGPAACHLVAEAIRSRGSKEGQS